MQVYMHTPNSESPSLTEIDANFTVREVIVTTGGAPDDELWMEEGDTPLDLGLTLEVAGVRDRHHVHRGSCRTIRVDVRFNMERKSKDFPPSTTIRRVFDWAAGEDGYDLTPAQKAKHVLSACGADHPLDWTTHIGSITTPGTCEACLDLEPKERFEG